MIEREKKNSLSVGGFDIVNKDKKTDRSSINFSKKKIVLFVLFSKEDKRKRKSC
jgi:hypothetical protein